MCYFEFNFFFSLSSFLFEEVNGATRMISSRCLNSVLRRSSSHRCYKSASRNHNSLIAVENPTKRFTVATSSAIQSIGSDRRTMATTAKPTLTLDSLNPNVIKMEYAVRGPLVIRAGEIEKEIKQVKRALSLPDSASNWQIDFICHFVSGSFFASAYSIVAMICQCACGTSVMTWAHVNSAVLLAAATFAS